MRDEMGTVVEKAAVAYLMVVTRNSIGAPEKKHENICKDPN
jgi:hypothetical protein